MQELALAEGALPRHIHTALFTSSLDNRMLTHRWDISMYGAHHIYAQLSFFLPCTSLSVLVHPCIL